MKKVFVARHPAEAHLVRGMLEANGIAVHVRGEDLFSVRGEVPVTPDTLPAVWVDEADASRAMSVLADAAARWAAASFEPAWTCAACNEPIEALFTECWRCGANRPPDASTS
ncbi:MAG: DUF2007 domain-containing protein [Acidobacteria bacterium]|nr:DUF2007 domain-containing protein [Acidobacteriota bacterium]